MPPTLNAEKPNPNIDFSQTPFFLLNSTRPWETANGTPRRAGVSAYGFGGTNFHVVLEEYIPGHLQPTPQVSQSASQQVSPSASQPISNKPVRGILALGAENPAALQKQLDEVVARIEQGWTPKPELPSLKVRQAAERLVIDFGNHEELLARAQRAQKAAGHDNPTAWQALQAQGIFRGSGKPQGKLAFMFPGQGSQYVNMGRQLAELSPIVQAVFAEADEVMTPILGRPLTSYIFVDEADKKAVAQANLDLMQTAITQPAMLTLDTAVYRLLASYGFQPDMVMGHSLGEYAGLIAAGILPFAHALEAAAARGREMSVIDVPDNGKMAAILAPYAEVERILQQVDGYVVPANVNSYSQAVIGGNSTAVEQACVLFEQAGYQAIPIPVSHAFHTQIVASASEPLGRVLQRMDVRPPQLPLVANVTGTFYPETVSEIISLLQEQIASPVQWVKGLETLYAAGARTFVEVGPKRALQGFANDVFKKQSDVLALMTNHPKQGDLVSFNQALCGLYAAGYGLTQPTQPTQPTINQPFNNPRRLPCPNPIWSTNC
jgi:acyl transferase domain-containing protein